MNHRSIPDAAAVPCVAFTRRDVLKVGAGFAAIATVGTTLGGCGKGSAPPAQSYAFLRPDDVALFTALVPGVVAELGRFPPEQRAKLLERTVRGIDGSCAALDFGGRGELRKLFDLLAIKPVRYLFAGIGDWKNASPADIEAFLGRWQGSRFGTLNAGGNVLVKLAALNFYLQPESWPSTGYPGPLAYMYQAINA